jgi:hypothetical protein
LGEDHTRQVAESAHRAERNWVGLERVLQQASAHGNAHLELAPGEHLWAARPEQKEDIEKEILELAAGGERHQLGTSLGLMNGTDGLYPPPTVWPISLELRFAVLERELLVWHLLAYASLEGTYGEGSSIAITDGTYPIVVTTDGTDYHLSRRFLVLLREAVMRAT